MNELQALQLVSNLNGKSFDEMLAAAMTAGHDASSVKLRFRSLYEKGYIEGASVLQRPVYLTVSGADRLEQLCQEAKDKAEAEKQRRFQNKVSVASVLVPLVTFVLGLVVEHCAGLVALLLDLLR